MDALLPEKGTVRCSLSELLRLESTFAEMSRLRKKLQDIAKKDFGFSYGVLCAHLFFALKRYDKLNI